MILITGSAGFVGQRIINELRSANIKVVGIDVVESDTTDILMNINDMEWSWLEKDQNLHIIHCAAARFDYGVHAQEYHAKNVADTENFCSSLAKMNVKHFSHISSVAAFDGAKIKFSRDLDCDNAYRSTKFLQEQVVIDYCKKYSIELAVHYPSAIYDDNTRLDTNIGKLIAFTNRFGVFPSVPVKKSVTSLSKFCDFVCKYCIDEEVGNFICIEMPVQTVDQIIDSYSSRVVKHFKIIGFRYFLISIGTLASLIGRAFQFDPKITLSRVIKLYNDTSYEAYYRGENQSVSTSYFNFLGSLNDKRTM